MFKKFSEIDTNGLDVLSDDGGFHVKLSILADKNDAITMHIDQFVNCLKLENNGNFTPITQRQVLETGHYGTFKNMKIWVSKMVPPEHYFEGNLYDNNR